MCVRFRFVARCLVLSVSVRVVCGDAGGFCVVTLCCCVSCGCLVLLLLVLLRCVCVVSVGELVCVASFGVLCCVLVWCVGLRRCVWFC